MSKSKPNLTLYEIHKETGINRSSLKHIIQYLEIEIIEQIGNRKYYSYEDYQKIKSFLKEHPYPKTFFAEQTNLKIYGVANQFQRKDVREKCEQGAWSEKARKKRTKTNKKVYGADTATGNPEIQAKIQKARSEKKDEIIAKTKQTKKERYGDENYNNREKARETCNERYGTDTWVQTEEAKQLMSDYWANEENVKARNETTIKSSLEKYGTESPNQVREVRLKQQHKYLYDGLKFDSSWELAYYIWLIDKEKSFEYQVGKFEFTYKGKKHYYIPDFKVGNRYVEIKGDQFFDKNGKMKCPWDSSLNGLFRSKQKCMEKNHVKVLRNKDMIKYLKYIEDNYTKDYLSLFSTKLEFPYLNDPLTDNSDFGLIHHFHKSIYEGNVGNKLSPLEAWNDKDLIKKVALNRLEYIGKCRPSDILQGFNVMKVAPKVSVFHPKFAEDLISSYLDKYSEIIDPFSGFSGRMIASINLHKQYIGKDINKTHIDESKQIKKYLKNKTAKLYVEDILIDKPIESYECLFTCPPYNLKENWNNENQEDLSCDEWIDICLERYRCKRYLFVVDSTAKYKKYIVEEKVNSSHFGKNKEYVICFNRNSRGLHEFIKK